MITFDGLNNKFYITCCYFQNRNYFNFKIIE